MPKNNPLSLTEASVINSMSNTEGWKVLAQELRQRFKDKFRKLRSSNRDSAFYKIQGYLDAIDEVFIIVEQKMLDAEMEQGGGF